MKCNLALHIFSYIVLYGSGGGVSLGKYRHDNNIPTATFYRHVRSLIQMGMIVRIGRDNYAISKGFIVAILDYEMPSLAQILPDRQMEMFGSDYKTF